MKGQLAEMMGRHALPGRLAWIGLRIARREDVVAVTQASVTVEGLVGDHAKAGKRAVTLIQSEHLPTIAALAGLEVIQPYQLRRNLMVSGINLYALRKAEVQIGTAILKIEGPCPPCSRMEEILGPGGYNAVRGHGGWYASVVEPGHIDVGAPVTVVKLA